MSIVKWILIVIIFCGIITMLSDVEKYKPSTIIIWFAIFFYILFN